MSKMPPINKQIIYPDEGWKPKTWYLCEVAMKSNNPIHKHFFFSGFLNGNGVPAGYSGGFPVNYAPNYDRCHTLDDYYYFNPIIEISTD